MNKKEDKYIFYGMSYGFIIVGICGLLRRILSLFEIFPVNKESYEWLNGTYLIVGIILFICLKEKDKNKQ